ncbi:cell division protein FtsQ/DivIB [Desulfuribacillus alkaliarsenatis]|uniref:POTRA domain-containing protein n=1 Tax=Desulfuribacillus alkaliarsenatis TaxID=766136 RepID=A0A1E5FZR3_9FIRM|nr:FtsQ-type POTRA domain-containing protein [Desulfuribacillus alkaliarsenatis]OEF96071.1 hypothetical protein BHF68_10045 [Desulfuribacillus alkaliarsenatis]
MSYRPTEDYDKIEEEVPLKHWANKFLHGIIVLLFFLVICVSIFLYSPYSKVQEITISGSDLVDEQLVMQATRIELGDSFLKVNTKKIKDTIEKLKPIKSVDVTFNFPNTIHIDIVEKRVVSFLYNSDNSLIPLLEDGTVLHNYNTPIPFRNRPIINSSIQESSRYNIANHLKDLPTEVLLRLSEITQDDGVTVIYTRDGYELRMFSNEISDKLFIFRDIMDQLHFYGDSKGVVNMFDAIWYISYEDVINESLVNNQEIIH